MHYIGSLVLILWLIIGAVAAGQRHDYTRPPANCSQAATIAVTILAGPLNSCQRKVDSSILSLTTTRSFRR